MSTHNDASHPVMIAGAGIGGLTAALALRQNGHSVIVMEKARELSEVGAGLQLSPNACSVLDRLDVLSSLKATAYAPENLRLWSGETGRQLARVRLGTYLEQRHGQPFWVIHRADLQRALLEKVHQTPGIDLRLGAEILDLSPSPYGHLVCIYQTDEINGNLDCKALIGADGVWSKTRKLVPAHQNAHFSGQVAYRATIPLDKLPARWSGDSGLWLHKNSHLVHYPIRGGRELNIVALAEEAWQDETWSAREEKETVLRVFKNWPADVRNLLKASETWLKWALCSVDASGPWTHGHLALMGDAAHAMLPYMAQGAGMAIEDAAILAKHLPADVENVPAALRAFERERKPRVKRVQETASGNARTFHLSGIPAFARDTFLRWSKPEALAARYDDIYGWTPER
ncbi:3-hydroxybenzoate 6-hydroxylase 1 [Labrenzia sp. THAF82]|uniref:FAD-dependent monooxygenase n=1 Tax=Labrenzia sp. THAF82 TaxID=2587861 RepID=UPI0012679622|nr:FAD-dependent monooxygenase [Labrenzia sp. THAF82]QFT31643.1 3-hydroxybenzoate 6-hydroxylase 1 [Labrenzia sp. THAF82]